MMHAHLIIIIVIVTNGSGYEKVAIDKLLGKHSPSTPGPVHNYHANPSRLDQMGIIHTQDAVLENPMPNVNIMLCCSNSLQC